MACLAPEAWAVVQAKPGWCESPVFNTVGTGVMSFLFTAVSPVCGRVPSTMPDKSQVLYNQLWNEWVRTELWCQNLTPGAYLYPPPLQSPGPTLPRAFKVLRVAIFGLTRTADWVPQAAPHRLQQPLGTKVWRAGAGGALAGTARLVSWSVKPKAKPPPSARLVGWMEYEIRKQWTQIVKSHQGEFFMPRNSCFAFSLFLSETRCPQQRGKK